MRFNNGKADGNKLRKELEDLLSSHHILFSNNMLYLEKELEIKPQQIIEQKKKNALVPNILGSAMDYSLNRISQGRSQVFFSSILF